MDKKKYEAAKEKDRQRKRAKSHDSSSSSLESSFLSRESLGKALKHVTEKIPKSPGKKKELLTIIVATLSPKKKGITI